MIRTRMRLLPTSCALENGVDFNFEHDPGIEFRNSLYKEFKSRKTVKVSIVGEFMTYEFEAYISDITLPANTPNEYK